MADTGFKFPTANGGKYNTWTNPTNAYADDGNYTTKEGDDSIKYQSYETFDFGLSGDITINGIEVNIQAKKTGANRDMGVGIYSTTDGDWGIVGSGYVTVTTTETVFTVGGSTELWGRNWALSDFSNANFSARFGTYLNASTGEIYSVDYIKIKVYYTVNSTAYELVVTKGSFTLTGYVTTLSRPIINLIADIGHYTLTGYTTTLNRLRNLTADIGHYLLTGLGVVLRKSGWTNESKHNSTTSNLAKHNSSTTNESKHNSNITNQSKS